jgi:hypothetical protein
MSRKGNCWDNAVVESFFSTLKMELVHDTDFATHEQVRAALFEYVEVFYNWQRRHSSLGYLSPVEFATLPRMRCTCVRTVSTETHRRRGMSAFVRPVTSRPSTSPLARVRPQRSRAWTSPVVPSP